MNNATQPQHFTLRSGSSTSGSPASSRASLQSGLVLVVLAALQQIMHGHGAAVVVDVVAALAVGDALDETGGVRSGRRQRVGGVRVSDFEGDLDRLGVDERGAAGQRNAAARVAGEKELSELGKYCTSCRAVT